MPESGQSCLLLRVGTHVVAEPVTHVEETMRPLPLRPIAGAPSFVSGVAIVRGAPVPVVDAAALLGEASSGPGRFVTLKTASGRVAIAVDAVIGIRTLPDVRLAAMPPLLAQGREDVVAALGTLDGDLLLVLQSGRLVPDEVWAAIDGTGPS